ncbi:MAG TPA: SusC/RagA family TonB-linked outer membrane protein, partial [Agriterribacter sp.]|nr:SusC/RagA family TonB-linked outer membrane protein [Agriterribacter sp.]
MSKLKFVLTCFFFLFSLFLFAQNRTITGRVTNANDQSAIIGATIAVKGSSQATTTATDGSFSLSVPSGTFTLVVSSVGFLPKEVTVSADAANVSVELSEDSQQLSEVVVTALGISREAKTLVYATQTVKPSTLTEVRDANNVLNSFQGKIANATIVQGSGGPGSGARIILRGNRSLQGNNNALIVVDGVPITNGTNGAAGSDFGSVQGSDGASNINPDDIESVTVLRGASAAALYGSAAGNGVIVITTKKGKEGKIGVTFNSGVGFESAFGLPEVQNSYGQGNGGNLNAGVGQSWGAKLDGQSYTNHLGEQASYSSQPDNIKDFFRNAKSYNNSIGVTGGSEKMQTYLSYTNNSVEGIVPRNNLLRHTVNLRLTNQIGKRFSTDAKVTYINQIIKNRPRTGEENAPAIDIYQIPRNVSTADAKQYEIINNVGVPQPTTWPSTQAAIYQNPYWLVNRSAINEVRDRIMGFVTAKYQITDWLSLAGRANLDKVFDRVESEYSTGTILWASQAGGYYGKSNINTTQKWFDVMLEGNNNITDDFKVDYRVGAIYQDNQWEQNNSTANGLNVTNKFSLNFATNPAISSGASQVQTQSVFGQVNFSFKDAIFLDASLRNDWSSTLPAPHSFSYPSVGASVILSDLFQLPEVISFLKVNANYASVGNGGRAQLLVSTYGYEQGAGNGFLSRSSVLPIPGLKPEIVRNFELGIEARFVNNRIGFTASYYKSNAFNQLLTIPLPTATGFGSQYINAGNIQN